MPPTVNASSSRCSDRDSSLSLIIFSSTFFMWGLVTVACNSLVSFYQSYFELNYSTVMLLLMAFFVSRVIVSLPTSIVMEKIGYRKTLKLAFLWCASGCGVLALCVMSETFPLLLFGVFVMASGITALQVVCSPYVSLSAPAEHSTRRQSIATASNSIGTIIAPSLLVLSTALVTYLDINLGTTHVTLLFTAIAVAFLVLYEVFTRLDIPDIHPEHAQPFWQGLTALRQNHQFMKLTLIIALYIGGEVIFGTLTISYLAEPTLGGLSLNTATQLISVYWGGMFLGRLWLARFGHQYNVGKLFVICSVLVTLTSASAVFWDGPVTGYMLLSVGLLNATMYPVIYAKALASAGSYRSQGAALLIMCSVGGALLPMLQGMLVDQLGLSLSFIVPFMIYLSMIVLYHRSKA